jgi:hypothetical protein
MFYEGNVLSSKSKAQAPSDGNQLEGANMIKITKDTKDIIIFQD